MSIEQVHECFKGEWVALEEIETTDALEVLSGLVVHHCSSRSEAWEALIRMKPRHCTVIFTGAPPSYENVNLNLGIFY